MEEQNQEKETVTQHVTVADAAAPDTGKGTKKGKVAERTRKPPEN